MLAAGRLTCRRGAFTLVEVLIVVVILAIIAMLVAPKYMSAAEDARESQLATDTQVLRKQINLYIAEHMGRGPELNEKGSSDRANFVARLTSRTTPDGKIDPAGTCGPYVYEWPANPFVPADVATTIKFAKGSKPLRDDRAGWYYATDTRILSPNGKTGGLSLDPAVP